MPLIGFEQAAIALRDYRCVYLAGHPGSYKTSLAFRMTWYLYKNGLIDRVISNAPSVWNERLNRLQIEDPRELRASIILDEGGLFLTNESKAKPFVAFLRKLDSYVFVPSVQNVTPAVKAMTIKLDIRAVRVGIPLLRYKVWLDRKAFTSFWWYNPSEIFGVYDTTAAVMEANEVADRMIEFQEQLVRITQEEAALEQAEWELDNPPEDPPEPPKPRLKPMEIYGDEYTDIEPPEDELGGLFEAD